ncbi:hypothetical protein PFICI_07564 [Pestalotiopsis fici W106-1]|uniref:AAA+ ATPase domain-containing protein n=1 Tax=Pestalotiopsis fici (strain W106-1 / CGMCC3.15140) TaxID=1229662 RepID=W3X1T2_PESFW|nr:uncharacterized protein PFICI_07564 [Pestalotiopsis fici W106-1]ETS80035.1 hypothetical protein PFICI_07564 [Pestalotiopsis fici W106-1]
MDHPQSGAIHVAAAPEASSGESKVAWSVSESYKSGTRIVSLGNDMTRRVEGRLLTVHSAPLSSLIRNIIKVYPGQKLTGSTLVFQEPYAALMHHMPDLEASYTDFKSQGEEHPADDSQLSHAFAALLDFLRPAYQECYVPAQERLSQDQPTVTFDDLWVLYRPNSLAYAKVDEHWIGCRIGATTKWVADPQERMPTEWQVGIWLLQTDSTTGEIGCATRTYRILDFDGEISPTELEIVPCQSFDKTDGGVRRRRFEERGQKILDILWGPSRQFRHNGEALHPQNHHEGDVLISGTFVVGSSVKCNWLFKWAEPWHFLTKDNPAYRVLERKIDPKRDSRDTFTGTMRFMLSPCLNALALWGATLHLVHVDCLKPSSFPDIMPEPVLHDNQLLDLIHLAEWHGAEGSILRQGHGDTVGNGVIVSLTGGPGVGKRYTANYVSWKTKRPLITIQMYESDENTNLKHLGRYLPRVSKIHNAMVLYKRMTDMHYTGTFKAPWSFLRQLDTMVFFSSHGTQSVPFSSIQNLVHMTISFSQLDHKRQKRLWRNMTDIYHTRRGMDSIIAFDRSASSFLSSDDMPEVNWNGHDIDKCLQAAIACAQAAGNPSDPNQNGNSIVVGVEHLKQAMNMTFANRLQDYDSSDDDVPEFGRFHKYNELSDDESPPSLLEKEKRRANFGRSKAHRRNLCIAELNRVEWATFKTLGATELFRSKSFHAIDVLVGEPQIWREPFSLLGQKHRIPVRGTAPQLLAPDTKIPQNTTDAAASAALPERIRINSLAIIKAFSELHIDDSSNLRGSFLLFRPYKVLSYYEKELRNWTERLEDKVKEDHQHSERVDEGQNGLQADVAEMKCLLSFIDTYLKERQEKIQKALIHSVSFDDLWFLFKPGDTVVRNDVPQAYRVVRVATTRHRIKEDNNTSLSFFRDDALMEFDQGHIFIQCVYIDFNGQLLGPVVDIVPIPHFKGEKAISSLPVYPLDFCDEPGIKKEFLLARGKAFVKAGSIKHMHYRGLTLPAIESSKLRDEVDSQVVVDFEEAFNRIPSWMPSVKKSVLEEFDDDDDDDSSSSSSSSSSSDKDQWKPEFYYTQNTSTWKCISDCCHQESVYHDEPIDDRTRNDYLASQANDNSTSPSVAIEARALSDLNDTLRDDDFLIMSYRVFGFVLRSRKWYQLDLADASPAETNSDGFDQLVLPAGHKDIIISMMTKHFRDRKSPSSRHIQTDIVRGKGRGLIMLLHGVPGVGKTSTAECLAGVFNRPLFQITSGDLGITAADVDKNLEEDFSLANRWNCILLIDEADVFLAQRNKEDFVQNSLVAVFLRIMEYYSGVLFLTTNRVGVFDEAFTSRIHISLYYPPLTRSQTLEIFKKNWERILARSKEDSRQIDINQSEITEFAMDYFDNNKQGRWNGRQIRNAFQSALAMAEFQILGMEGVNEDDNVVSDDQKPVQTVQLGKRHFEDVAAAYKSFIDYLNNVYGAGSARRARENMWRFDPEDESASKRPSALSQRLKFTREPTPQPPRNMEPGLGPSQYHRGYGPDYEIPSNYGPRTPPRGGGYPGPHEYQYPPADFPSRNTGMEQGLYSSYPRTSVPSANYPSAHSQTYGPRIHPTAQHEMQAAPSSWAGSSRDVQPGFYPHHPGEQTQRTGGGQEGP